MTDDYESEAILTVPWCTFTVCWYYISKLQVLLECICYVVAEEWCKYQQFPQCVSIRPRSTVSHVATYTTQDGTGGKW